MVAVGDARERRERFALASGAEHHHLVGGHVAHRVGVDDVVIVDVQVAEVAGDLGDVDHRAAGDHDLAAVGHRGVAHLLHAMHVARERRDDDPLLGGGEDRAQRGADLGLRRRVPRMLGAGGVAHEQRDALLGRARESGVVGHPPVDGRLVELEVAGVEHRAHGRAHVDRHAVGDRVVHREEVEAEHAEVHVAAGLDLAQLRLLDAVFLELARDDAERELGAEHGHRCAEVLEQVRQRARVVLVAVGDDDAAKLLFALNDVAVVRQDEIDAGVVVVREHESRVDDDHVVPELENGHVLADPVEPAERDDAKAILLRCHGRLYVLLVVSVEVVRGATRPRARPRYQS